MSLAVRLAAAFVGLIALTTLALGAASFVAAERGVTSQIDNFLEDRADDIIDGERGRPDRDDNRRNGRDNDNRRSVDDDAVVQTLNADGSIETTTGVVLPVSDADQALADGSEKRTQLQTVTTEDGDYRVLTAALPDGGAVQVGRELSESSSAVGLIQSQLVPIIIALAVLGGLLGLLLARRITSPLRSLATSVDTVAATGDLTVPINVRGDDEVSRLASGFQNLLDNLADSRLRQQQLVQDAAHELRTPLTSVKANIDLLAIAPDMDPDDRAQTFDSVRSELRELAQLVDEIVEVATDRYARQALTELDLVNVVNETVERFRIRTGRTVELDLAPSVLVRGDRDSLERVVGNLLSNADKYSPSSEPVAVTLTADRRVAVTDRGVGIDPAERERVFDRFYRSDMARSEPGSGLGLSIVKSIVTAHNGTVDIADGPTGGTTVSFTLPDPAETSHQ